MKTRTEMEQIVKRILKPAPPEEMIMTQIRAILDGIRRKRTLKDFMEGK